MTRAARRLLLLVLPALLLLVLPALLLLVLPALLLALALAVPASAASSRMRAHSLAVAITACWVRRSAGRRLMRAPRGPCSPA